MVTTPQQPPRKHAAATGFTLLELLVVVVIVAALSALGVAATRNLREGSQMTTCASNLRNIGVAMQLFSTDNDGRYPDTTHTTQAGGAWIYQLEAYLGDFDGSRICPADPQAKLRLENKASSYILNSLVFMPETDAFGEPTGPARNKPSLLPDPSRTILVFTASDRAGLHPGDDHTHSDQWRGWPAVLRDIAPDRHKHRSSKDSTKGRANYLYADGRVESISAHDIKTKIENGINIAAIPGVSP